MAFLTIQAGDIQLGDILGEGMEVWITVIGEDEITLWWDMAPLGLLHGSRRDDEHKLTFKLTDTVKVFRRR